MKIALFILVLVGLLFAGQGALADAPLKGQLDLSVEQAKKVADIRAIYRRPIAAKRQEFIRESRALRRARSAHDSHLIANQDAKVDVLRRELRKLRMSENEKIRSVLSPRQKTKFEKILQERRNRVGSSRDAND